MMTSARGVRLVPLWLAGCLAASAGARAEDWEGPKLKPVQREEVFEFARKPAVNKVGKDHYGITFASKGKCDVAVAIEDARGRIVRHVVAGVLGPNAPAPLKKDSLEQTVVWDGKDDAGRYVPEPETCTARVSLGLKPAFDKILAWHPKDTPDNRFIAGLAADKEGVYVLTLSFRPQLRMFDHDGNYLRTLVPSPADKIGTKALNAPTRQVEYTGRVVPCLEGWGGMTPFAGVAAYHSLAAANGRLALLESGSYGKRSIFRLRTDGTTGGEPVVGPLIDPDFGTDRCQLHVALSPDGKWVYLSRISRKGPVSDPYRDAWPRYWHTVFRVAWDGTGPVLRGNSFVGEVGRDAKSGGGEGDDDRRLNKPKGIALDAQGRLYVCDTGNNRIQVYATDGAEGKAIKTIKFESPQEIAVHQTTGEIYVLSFKCDDSGEVGPGTALRIVRLGPLEAPEVKLDQKVAVERAHEGERGQNFVPVMCLDSWAKPAKLWIQTRRGVVQIFADRGDKLELVDDFGKDVVAAGLRPASMGEGCLNTVAVDPVRGHLYYKAASMRLDPEGPGKWVPLRFPCNWQEMDFGLSGLLHVRQLTYLARFDPDKAVMHEDRGYLEFPFESEVPFDYGEEQKLPWQGRPLRGVIKIAAMPGANGFDNGIGVAPNGDVITFMKNYQDYKTAVAMAVEYVEMPAMLADRYRPKVFEGRHWTFGELVMRWDSRGELLGEDLVPSLPSASCGIKLDRDGNIYVGIGANMIMENGKPHSAGTLAKFPPKGGKFFGAGDMAKLKELPKRPAEFECYGWGKLWTKNLYWVYPGLDHMHFLGGGHYSCLCATARFDLDLYRRSFVPKAYQFTVGVVDTNGNPICEIGRYGNADSGRGPESPIKIGGPEIAVADCAFVTVLSDKWLYLNDDGNGRIVRVKLGYHVEERLPLR